MTRINLHEIVDVWHRLLVVHGRWRLWTVDIANVSDIKQCLWYKTILQCEEDMTSQHLIHFSMAAVSSVAFTRFTCKSQVRINMDLFCFEMYLLKELIGRTSDLIKIFQLCNLLSKNFFPKPWSSLKQISWWPPWRRNCINYWFGQCSTSLYLSFHLRWSSRTLGSVCWAEGSSSNFKPSIWGIFCV